MDGLATSKQMEPVYYRQPFLCTEFGITVHSAPDPSTSVVNSLYTGAPVTAYAKVRGTDGEDWYYMKSEWDKWGYSRARHFVPHVAGSQLFPGAVILCDTGD